MPGRISLMSVKCLESSAIRFSQCDTDLRANHRARFIKELISDVIGTCLQYRLGLANKEYWIGNYFRGLLNCWNCSYCHLKISAVWQINGSALLGS